MVQIMQVGVIDAMIQRLNVPLQIHLLAFNFVVVVDYPRMRRMSLVVSASQVLSKEDAIVRSYPQNGQPKVIVQLGTPVRTMGSKSQKTVNMTIQFLSLIHI